MARRVEIKRQLLAKAITELRQETELSQEAFWARIGVSQSGGSRYEHGSRPVPVGVAMLLIIAYGSEEDAKRMYSQLRGT